ncbi:MAG: hypothetical protein NVSMB60_25790 [Mycobacterium sp.]
MPMTVSNATGDGILTPLIQCSIELPDTGTAVTFAGQAQNVGGALMPLTGSPITIPTAPASGNTYYVLQAAYATGAVTMKQSASAPPTADAGNVIILTQTLGTTSTDPALVPETTPDTY